MNTCVKNVLVGTVNNPNLPIFGKTAILITDFANYNAAPVAQKQIIGSTSSVSSDNKYLIIDDKYSVTSIIEKCGGKSVLRINVGDFEWWNSLTKIDIVYQAVEGDFSKLPNTLEFLCCGKQLETPITDIGHLINLKDLVICSTYNFGFTGDLEDFVAAQIENGRTSCNDFVLGLRAAPQLQITQTLKYNGAYLTGVAKKVTWNWDGTSANITVTDYSA